MSLIIQALEKEQIRSVPDFSQGDTVTVYVKVTETKAEGKGKDGKAKESVRERLQAFEGVVIAIKNRGINSSFTVRKISHGEGVERVFQTHSPSIERIELNRRGKVRQAKLYYLRALSGRAARIKENLSKAQKDKAKREAEQS